MIALKNLIRWYIEYRSTQFSFIRKGLVRIMALVDELKAEVGSLKNRVAALRVSIDAREATIRTLDAARVAEIARLQALVDAGAGATVEDLQEILNGLLEVDTGIVDADADVASDTDDGS